MVRNLIALIVASILFVLGMRFIQSALQWLLNMQDKITQMMISLLPASSIGHFIARVIALLIIPIIVGIIIGVIMWLWQKRGKEACVYAVSATWIIWVILAAGAAAH